MNVIGFYNSTIATSNSRIPKTLEAKKQSARSNAMLPCKRRLQKTTIKN
jgi:hypothetical protein